VIVPEGASGQSAAAQFVICFVGDGPKETGGYDLHAKMLAYAREILLYLRPSTVISGLALGFETAAAEAALSMDIPLVAAIACDGWERKWIPSSQAKYKDVLGQARERVVVSPGEFEWEKVASRNRWMVDRSDMSLVLWAGGPKSSAKSALEHSENRNKCMVSLWESWKTYRDEGVFSG